LDIWSDGAVGRILYLEDGSGNERENPGGDGEILEAIIV
jgi:hypothetical protein